MQASLEPGADIGIRARLTEYDLPIDQRASMTCDVERPDGTTTTIAMNETEPGTFEGSTPGFIPGTWRLHVRATGATQQGMPFTREQQLTAPIIRGGDGPFPTGTIEPTNQGTVAPPRDDGTLKPRDECCNRIMRFLWIGLFLLLLILLVLLFKR